MKEKIIIANWKMKLNLKETMKLAEKFKKKFKDLEKGDVVICPSYIVLDNVSELMKDSPLKVGAQNVFWEDSGPFTGEISPSMLVEAGCEYVIIGHSERRKYLLENYAMMHQEVKAVLDAENLIPIICIGEEEKDRKTDKRDFVLVDQIHQSLGGIHVMPSQQIVVAYEPVWAIGSGLVIEPEEAEYAHKIIKLALGDIFGMERVKNNFRIIYGGSITSKNAKDFSNLENIDGILVGGASLDADEFYKISKIALK